MFEMALDDDVIRKNPAKNALKGYGTEPKIKEALSVQQQKMLFEFVERSTCYRKHLPMLEIMVGTAVRVGELTGLTWSDIDLQSAEIKIDHQLIYKNYGSGCCFHVSKPKTAAGERVIPITMKIRKALKEQRIMQFQLGINHNIEVDGVSGFVFTAKNGNPLATNAVNNILYNIIKAYNKEEELMAYNQQRKPEFLPKISARTLRHTGCTRMAESGMDAKVLQYIMGHTNISITFDTYTHITDKERIKKEFLKVEEVAM